MPRPKTVKTTKTANIQTFDGNDMIYIYLDRPRYLRYGHKALKRLTALTGKSLNAFASENMELDELEKILYCGLLSDAAENGETLKLEDMEDLLDQAESFNVIIESMNKALERAFGSVTAEKN